MFACTGDSGPVPVFNGTRAFTYLEQQVAFGPRVPGSEPWRVCREYFVDFFDSLNLSVDSQSFYFRDPYSGHDIPLVNLIVSVPGTDSDRGRIALLAHWDTRPIAEYATDSSRRMQPIDGANDGASGVAVLMELANALSDAPPPAAVDLILVDGEDWGRPGHLDYYMLGSKEFARQGIRGRYRFGIVVDMIGDADQSIPREGFSETYCKQLNDMIWEIADEQGIKTFMDSVSESVYDDHTSFNAVGVPCIDLIDFDYPYWHTEFDTPDKCSSKALENVGRVLMEVIYRPNLWPKLK